MSDLGDAARTLAIADAVDPERRKVDRRAGSEKVPCRGPACDSTHSFVYDSRGVLRYRQCVACGFKFVTEEVFLRKVG